MRYADGQEVKLGDRVSLDQYEDGVVVCSLDACVYSADYPSDHWSYLNGGILIEFPLLGLIHYKDAEPELHLVERVS